MYRAHFELKELFDRRALKKDRFTFSYLFVIRLLICFSRGHSNGSSHRENGRRRFRLYAKSSFCEIPFARPDSFFRLLR